MMLMSFDTLCVKKVFLFVLYTQGTHDQCLLCLTFNLKALFVKTNCCRVVAFQLLLILLVVDKVITSVGF